MEELKETADRRLAGEESFKEIYNEKGKELKAKKIKELKNALDLLNKMAEFDIGLTMLEFRAYLKQRIAELEKEK